MVGNTNAKISKISGLLAGFLKIFIMPNPVGAKP
jgi:hypothetical protein